NTAFGIAAMDTGSGVGQIFVDSGTGGGFQLFSGTFTYPNEGQHTIKFFAVDNVGNTSTPGRFQVFTDTTGPPVSSSPTIPTVQIGSVTYARLATGFAITTGIDNLSGIQSVTVLADTLASPSPVRFLNEGTHTLEAF